MEFRTAFPIALLLGGALGAAAVAGGGAEAPGGARAGGLIAEATAATTSARWDIPVVVNAPVQRFVDLFSDTQSDRMALYLKRSGRYEGMIRAKLRAKGMPEDLIYLSMIESGFDPTARSRAQAVGLWQFMAPTARGYGLRVDPYVDERRHPEKSTDAALRYLSDLHAQFGSWYLAAAAYNTGDGRLERTMRSVTGRTRGADADFWRIRHRLPAETREYVPLMVAAALVGKEPHKYGLGNVQRWLPLSLDSVSVPGGTPLATVAEAVGARERELARLNPHLVKKMTPPGKAYPVRIPRGRGDEFAAHFPRLAAESAAKAKAEAARHAELAAARREAERREAARVAARARTHTVRNGESLWTIARRNDTSVARLKAFNGLRTNRLRPGQKIRIPRSGR